MSERRRLRAGQTGPGDSAVPLVLRRFRAREWDDGAGGDYVEWSVRARRRWDEARREWAHEHGYVVSAKYGQAPGRDWWAFLELCRGEAAEPQTKHDQPRES